MHFRILFLAGIVLLSASCTTIFTKGPGSEWAAYTDEIESLYNQGLYSRALAPAEKALKIADVPKYNDHLALAISLNNLAIIYRDTQGKYAEAEQLLKRAIKIEENNLGIGQELVAMTFEKNLNSVKDLLATSLNNLATVYKCQSRYDEAEPLYKRALGIEEKMHGLNSQQVGTSLNNLALLYRAQGRYPEAESLLKQSTKIMINKLGSYHPIYATTINNLALLYFDQGRYAEAEPLFKDALQIRERALGPESVFVAASLENLAILYRATGRANEADKLERRSTEIRKSKNNLPD